MKCPLGRKFSVCQTMSGFFMGAKEGEHICCRVTDYVAAKVSVASAEMYVIPERIDCDNRDCVLCKEEVSTNV